MKVLAVVIFVLIPVSIHAQNFQNMNEQDMQKMMMQAQKVQACMEKIDQAELKGIEQRSKEFDAEIKSLCAAGKRDKAQKKAIAFGREMAKNPVLQEMKKCGELMRGVMPDMPMVEDFEDSDTHVCDDINQ
jgi:cell fate (sporulation/competence/biofilm development) regulator YmcA (YheA/YmcA/DUF963 family)